MNQRDFRMSLQDALNVEMLKKHGSMEMELPGPEKCTMPCVQNAEVQPEFPLSPILKSLFTAVNALQTANNSFCKLQAQ
jgi:hypothetical protein